MKLILASKSPRRKEILSRLNIPFSIIPSEINEALIKSDKKPHEYAQKVASIKCNKIGNRYTNHTVIGADTIVITNKSILGKPKNKNEARYMLQQLSGKKHEVITGVSIQNINKNICHSFFESTIVDFYKIPENYISKYINSESPYDKAGAYGIQDWSSIFVKKINGSYDNVVGFPLSQFIIELNKLGIKF